MLYILCVKTNDKNKTISNKKKATNRDVAKLAGVSVATVSYVINGREDQHISEETKKKVLHAINFLNYIPNPHAVGLNTPQPQTILIRSASSVSHFTESEILFFMHTINPICQEQGYQLNYSMDKRAERLAANACICFDMPNEEFHALSSENFIPVVAIDSLINDPVFYQITLDYGKVYSAAAQYFGGENFTYCCIEPQNMQLKEDILSHFENVLFINSARDMRACLTKTENITVTQPTLAKILGESEKSNVFFYEEHILPRARITVDCIRKAIDRLNISDEEHYIKV